jgi:coproporphyrinogen III oxidase-like Fe-S oxidoreductase
MKELDGRITTMNQRNDSTSASQTGQTKEKPASLSAIVENGITRSIAEWVLTPYLRMMTDQYLRLRPVENARLPVPIAGRGYTLYLHVPFCETLCPYCSFNRYALNEKTAHSYFRALRQEMHMVHQTGYRFSSLYIGGGTPTILIDELVETIDLARELFPIGEVSCETNPNHLIPEVLDKLIGRVQRLSVGVQSFDDGLLKQMERLHKYGSGAEILDKIRLAAPLFPSLNVDMIYNFPGQSEEILLSDIRCVKSSGAQQTTFYPLMSSRSVKEDLKQSVGQVDYGREAGYYRIIMDELGQDFTALSSWTFHRNGSGMLDEYIANGNEYVGLGSGAFSYLDGALYVNTFSLKEYEKAIQSGRSSVYAERHYGRREQMRYSFMMELFGLQFNRERFKKTFDMSMESGLWFEFLFMRMVKAFSRVTSETCELTPRGKYLSVVMMREFFSGVNNVRDAAREALQPCASQANLPAWMHR